MERCDNIAHNLSSRSKYLQLFYNILIEFKNSTSYSSAMEPCFGTLWSRISPLQLNLTASQKNFFVEHLLLASDSTSRKILVLFLNLKHLFLMVNNKNLLHKYKQRVLVYRRYIIKQILLFSIQDVGEVSDEI